MKNVFNRDGFLYGFIKGVGIGAIICGVLAAVGYTYIYFIG